MPSNTDMSNCGEVKPRGWVGRGWVFHGSWLFEDKRPRGCSFGSVGMLKYDWLKIAE